MSKTDVKKTNYTPLLDSLVDEYGLTVAAVFGRVWRYCQMENGYCHAEQERIADELNISRKTVWAALQVLVRDGYLTDTTPNTKGRTRIYKDTGRAGIKRLLAAEVVQEPVQEVVQEPVQNLLTKKVKKEKKDTTTSGSVAEFSFLEKANTEQREAYDLVRRFASHERAVEVASRENPLDAARDFLEWCAERGGKVAKHILEETQKAEQRAEVTLELKQRFLDVANLVGYTDTVTHGMFDEWIEGATGNGKIEVNYSLLRYRELLEESMKKYFKWAGGDPEEITQQEIDAAEEMARQAEQVRANGYERQNLEVEF